MRTFALLCLLVVPASGCGAGLPPLADVRHAVQDGQAGVDKVQPSLEALRGLGAKLCAPGAELLPVGDCAEGRAYLDVITAGFLQAADAFDSADLGLAVIEAGVAAAQ